MKKVKLLVDNRVNLPAGTIVEVSEQERDRLLAFSVAVDVVEAKEKKVKEPDPEEKPEKAKPEKAKKAKKKE